MTSLLKKYSQNLDLIFKTEGGMITFAFFNGILKSILDISIILLEVTRVLIQSPLEWVCQSLCANKWDKAWWKTFVTTCINPFDKRVSEQFLI